MVQEWSKDVPAAWETMLRAFSPHSRVVPWLAIRWFPARRVIGGVPTDCGRWLLSECVPVDTLSEIDRSIVAYFEGPKPSTMPESRYRVVKTFCNDYQWEMYRTHRVWARELWIVQGNAGGHATQFAPEEQQLLQAKGLPTDPPALGALPYAPVDQRVLAAMHRRKSGNIPCGCGETRACSTHASCAVVRGAARWATTVPPNSARSRATATPCANCRA